MEALTCPAAAVVAAPARDGESMGNEYLEEFTKPEGAWLSVNEGDRVDIEGLLQRRRS